MASTTDPALWLQGIHSDCTRVREGVTRQEVLETFQHASANTFREAFYVHRECSCVELELEFQTHEPPTYDPRGGLLNTPHPLDRVWKVSLPYLRSTLLTAVDNEPAVPFQHRHWLATVLAESDRVRRDMTRRELEEVYEGAAGISSPFENEFFWHRRTNYIHVQVEFQPYGGAHFDADGRIVNEKHPRDIIWRISFPYLAYPVYD